MRETLCDGTPQSYAGLSFVFHVNRASHRNACVQYELNN